MKTIFIPIFQGQQARNIFLTGIFTLLKNLPDYRLVIFTKPDKVIFYRSEYGGDNIEVIGVDFFKSTKIEQVFQNLCLISIDTETIRLRQLRTYYETGGLIKYFIKRLLTKVIGNSAFFQTLLRKFDQKFFYKETLEAFFEQYQPDLVFSPNVLGKFDLSFLKTAKKLKIKTVALVNSWDNLSSRGLMRSLPDRLLVHNEEIKEDAVCLQSFPVERISVCGLPHFDYYLTSRRSNREVFYERIGVPLDRKIILFCPAGSRMNKTEWQVIESLDHAIKSGEICFPAHILVRQPPNADMFMGDLKESENITFDRMSNKFKTSDPNDWEWQHKDMVHLADSLFYSVMVINYASTMSIDAAAFDKPVISVAFDGFEKLGPTQSFSWFYYRTTHYKKLLKLGGVKLASDMPNLINVVNKYYSNPELDQEERKKMAERQVWRLDGQASERVVRAILSAIDTR